MNYQLLLFIIQYLKFRLIRSTGLLGRGIFQNPLSAGVVFYPPSALNDSRVAMGFNTTASAGKEITYIWYLFIFRCFINVVPLKAIAVISQIRPEGDTLTMMSRGCPALPECNSTFFSPSWLILQSQVADFEMHILTYLPECKCSHLLSQQSGLMLIHRDIFLLRNAPSDITKEFLRPYYSDSEY